eukprot:TRINITY_DN73006_c0_g1_i1.p1 TRINITY_DN73006_c0_g1~~TRINITY_DN73006_c0_g1_i1.p1  ORF type:complete len:736 (-),score=130.45 TRINITY_DN73006_c0_g1_i1:86-2293(-)
MSYVAAPGSLEEGGGPVLTAAGLQQRPSAGRHSVGMAATAFPGGQLGDARGTSAEPFWWMASDEMMPGMVGQRLNAPAGAAAAALLGGAPWAATPEVRAALDADADAAAAAGASPTDGAGAAAGAGEGAAARRTGAGGFFDCGPSPWPKNGPPKIKRLNLSKLQGKEEVQQEEVQNYGTVEKGDVNKRYVYDLTNKRTGMDLADYLVPWHCFVLVFLPFGLAYYELTPLCWFALGYCLYVSNRLFYLSVGAPWKLLSCFTFAATVMGLLGGCYVYQKYISYLYAYDSMPQFTDVHPSMSPIAYQDAGYLNFDSTTYVDAPRGVGLKSGSTYCAAPISSQKSMLSVGNKYGFWAVGEDCCTERGTFFCGGPSGVGGTGGAVLIPGSPSYSAAYLSAVQMASVVYNVGIPNEPILVRWASQVVPEQQRLRSSAAQLCITACLVFLAVPLIISIFLRIARPDLARQIPPELAKQWQWHPGDAAQMEFGFDLFGKLDPDTPNKQQEVRELQRDLIEDRHYWSGEVLHDYAFYVANTHIFVSVVACHPLHPFTKAERAVVALLTSLLLVFPVAALRASTRGYHWADVVVSALILFMVTIPRNVLKGRLQKAAMAEEAQELLDGPADEAPEWKTSSKFVRLFLISFTVVLLVCVASCEIITHNGNNLMYELWLACQCLGYCFVLSLLFKAIMPEWGPAHCEDLRGRMFLGFFNRWSYERQCYLRDPRGFLWRAQRLRKLGY